MLNLFKLFRKSIKIIKNEGFFVFFKKGFNFLKTQLLFLILRFKRKRIIEEIKKFDSESIDEILNFAFTKFYEFIQPCQIQDEFKELLKIFKEKKPQTILEIGTAKGGSLFCFCKLALKNTTIISIDLPGGQFGGGYPKWKIPVYQAFAKKGQKLYLLREDSHSEKTFQNVKEILNGKGLDFLFIDGDHTYEGVKKDFEIYSTLMNQESIIAFHDIVYHPFVPECEVNKLWQEIKEKYKTKEIKLSLNQMGYGIGIVYV